MKKLLLFLVLFLIAGDATAQVTVTQGQGNNNVVPWKARIVSSTGASVDAFGTFGAFTVAGAPAASVAVSVASAAATGLTAGAVYRVACNIGVFFRVGSGTPTAVATDSPIYGPAIEYIGLPIGSTAFAFITTAGTGTCVLTRITAN